MGHYDECRDGYCGICGQTNGNCEHTQRGNRSKMDMIDDLCDIKEEDRVRILAKADMEEAVEFMSHFSPIKPRFTKDEQHALDDLIFYAKSGANADYIEDTLNYSEKSAEVAYSFACEQIDKIKKMLAEDGGYV